MHTNYFTFKSTDHYDLGHQMGEAFKKQAETALNDNPTATWGNKVARAEHLLACIPPELDHYIDELKGYAAGANVPFIDFWTLSLEDDAEPLAAAAKCTTIIAKDATLIGHNEDTFDEGLEDTVAIVQKTIKNLTTLEIFYYNTLGGSSVGVNSNGYVHAINTLIKSRVNKDGIPKSIIARKFLDTNNPVHDYEYFLQQKRASGFNHNLVKKGSLEIINIEFTVDDPRISRLKAPFVHTNHCLLAQDYTDTENISGTQSRLQTAKTFAGTATDEQSLVDAMADQSLGREDSIHNMRTIAKMIVNLEENIAKLWLLREKEKNWIDYELKF
jgi:hypothetical protein